MAAVQPTVVERLNPIMANETLIEYGAVAPRVVEYGAQYGAPATVVEYGTPGVVEYVETVAPTYASYSVAPTYGAEVIVAPTTYATEMLVAPTIVEQYQVMM